MKSIAKDVTERISDLKVLDMGPEQEPLRAQSKSTPGTAPVFYEPWRNRYMTICVSNKLDHKKYFQFLHFVPLRSARNTLYSPIKRVETCCTLVHVPIPCMHCPLVSPCRCIPFSSSNLYSGRVSFERRNNAKKEFCSRFARQDL